MIALVDAHPVRSTARHRVEWARHTDNERTCMNSETRVDAEDRTDALAEYAGLIEQLGLDRDIPLTPDWSAAADFVQLIADHCLQTGPKLVMECSSGLTSVVLARCCQINGRGRVVSLENGEPYAEATRASIARYGLTDCAEVIHAPLTPVTLEGVSFDWYATDSLPDQSIDMLVIDGPPGFIQKHSRYPALPLLYSRLADGCTIFLDDAARPDEQAIVARWQEAFPGLELEYHDNERGCAVLMINR